MIRSPPRSKLTDTLFPSPTLFRSEYAGGAGLVSKLVTKSGGDEFHGSVNYYLQNDSLVSDDKHGQSAGFSTFDTAITLGGPIVKEKLWFFGSYQIKNREDDVVDPVTGDALRTVTTDQDLAFFKATWQITDNDRLKLGKASCREKVGQYGSI